MPGDTVRAVAYMDAAESKIVTNERSVACFHAGDGVAERVAPASKPDRFVRIDRAFVRGGCRADPFLHVLEDEPIPDHVAGHVHGEPIDPRPDGLRFAEPVQALH